MLLKLVLIVGPSRGSCLTVCMVCLQHCRKFSEYFGDIMWGKLSSWRISRASDAGLLSWLSLWQHIYYLQGRFNTRQLAVRFALRQVTEDGVCPFKTPRGVLRFSCDNEHCCHREEQQSILCRLHPAKYIDQL